VPKSEIDERYVDSPYYLVPENKVALEAFAVIRDAMRGKDMVGLGRVVLSKRERVVMLQPRSSGLPGTTLRYPYEVRDEEIYFGDIAEVKIPKDMIALAEHILESKAAKFDSSKFHDRYEATIIAMINEKKAGLPVSKQRELPRVVAGTAKETATKQAAAVAPNGKKAAKRNAGQREMLLPIAGDAQKEAGEKQSQKTACERRLGSRPGLPPSPRQATVIR
jgi:DNA end-binding protein Ku